MSIVEKHAPPGNMTLKGNDLPCITSDIKKLIRQRDYLRGKANNENGRAMKTG